MILGGYALVLYYVGIGSTIYYILLLATVYHKETCGNQKRAKSYN